MGNINTIIIPKNICKLMIRQKCKYRKIPTVILQHCIEIDQHSDDLNIASN